MAAHDGKLALMVLIHIDDDHIVGLLELLIELRQQRMEGLPETIGIEEIWHNTFSQATSPEIEQRVAPLLCQGVGLRGLSPPEETVPSVSQGDELTQYAIALQIPINVSFGPYRPISVEDVGRPTTFQTQVALRLIGTGLQQHETMGVAAQAIDNTAEIVLKQIRDYFEEMMPSHQ